MESLPLPQHLKVINLGKHHDSITIEPCFPGYGITLANALRRVMISSLPGAAVTAVKVVSVSHEFSSIPGVKEDVVDILLNLRRLRLIVHNSEPVKIILKASGEREVTATDIKTTSDVEIISKDLHIATLTEKKAELEMELTVRQGRGYVPVESSDKEKEELGQIAVDAIFTPIVKVGFNIEDVRVGQTTNFDRIIFDIETDGTVSPLEAICEASKILINHFNFIINEDSSVGESVAATDETIVEENKPVAKKRGRPKKEINV
ncbi:MAG: DNA-directed RNA polymerase subunit alpha [Patescibacteria group bacterium]